MSITHILHLFLSLWLQSISCLTAPRLSVESPEVSLTSCRTSSREVKVYQAFHHRYTSGSASTSPHQCNATISAARSSRGLCTLRICHRISWALAHDCQWPFKSEAVGCKRARADGSPDTAGTRNKLDKHLRMGSLRRSDNMRYNQLMRLLRARRHNGWHGRMCH